MDPGENTKVCSFHGAYVNAFTQRTASVDYILFLTADVDVTPNVNEIRDYKYVDKAELQAMFEDSSEYLLKPNNNPD